MSSKEEYSKYVKKITWTLLKPLTHSFYENGTFGKVFEKFQTVEFNLDVYGSDQLIDPPPTPPTELCISELSIEARRLPYMPFKSLRRCFRPKRRSPGTLSSSEKTDEIGALDTPGLDKPLGGPLEGFRFKSINHLHLHDVGCLDEFEGRTMVLRNSLLDKLAKPEEERYENWTSFINSHKHSLKSFSFSQKHRRLSMRGQKRLWLFYQSTHAYGGTPDVHVADQCVGYILPLITSGGWDNLETLKLCNVGAGVGRYIGSLFVLYGGLDAAHQEKIRSAVGSGVKVEMS
ncbi:hypothetical protein GX51_02344 [Blastomyces parvus]|uniref:Uncharacterized protein n=1 Tax=Blastomyces parvus TaxID=2060905 RepID=A0A2B7XCA4_9EURO|nr:hypothetical protein GX51_02344 [Blastomyces parvus]